MISDKLVEKLENPTKKIRMVLMIGTGLIILSGLINLFQLLLLPADLKTAILFGYSSRRLAMIAFLILGILAFCTAFLKLVKGPPNLPLKVTGVLKNQSFLAFLVLFFFISLSLVWITGFSTEHFLGSATYFAMTKRLLPLCIWFLSISLIIIGICIFLQNSTLNENPIADKKNWRLLSIAFVIMVLLFLFTAWIFPILSEQLWWVSVPILITQIFAAWTIATFVMLIPSSFFRGIPDQIKKRSDIFIFILIWVISAVLWVNQPVDFESEEYSLTPQQQQFIIPRRPNYELYPRFDSETYFNISESIVMGGGIYRSLDKPFFHAIEGLINWMAGGSFEKMLDLQTILLASFPALIFILGSKLHSRVAGLFAASLALIQGINGIRLMASTKVLLSEPFMQLCTVVITLSAFLALKASGKERSVRFLFLGGVLGLSALIRLNTIVLVPFILLIALFYYARERKTFFLASGVFIIGIFMAFTPWMIHNSVEHNHPFAFVLSKVRGVIVNSRYDGINDKIELSEASGVDIEEPQDPEDPEALVESIPKVPTIKPSIPVTILRHFLNNTITSFSTLPGSGIPQDLIYGSRNQRYWAGFDTTLYESVAPAFFIFNLFILSIGVSSIIKKHRAVGFIPIAVFFGYHLSSGIAIASGHRYAQPVSWIVFFYYAVGLISISRELFSLIKIDMDSNLPKLEDTVHRGVWKPNLIAVSLFILLLGSTPVIADLLPINRYPEISESSLFAAVNNKDNLRFSGEKSHIEVFFNAIEAKNLNVVYGRILAPIFADNEKYLLFYGKENFGGKGTYLTFNVLGPGSGSFTRMIFYPQGDLVDIKSGSDAVIFLNKENDKRMVIGIGIIDPDFSSKVSSYEKITQIPFSNFYPSKDYSTLIGITGK